MDVGWGGSGVPVGDGSSEWGRLGGLSCNISVSCSILSHTYGSWYFPRFPFNSGSLTLMNIASFMVLEKTGVSLWIMLKQSSLMHLYFSPTQQQHLG